MKLGPVWGYSGSLEKGMSKQHGSAIGCSDRYDRTVLYVVSSSSCKIPLAFTAFFLYDEGKSDCLRFQSRNHFSRFLFEQNYASERTLQAFQLWWGRKRGVGLLCTYSYLFIIHRDPKEYVTGTSGGSGFCLNHLFLSDPETAPPDFTNMLSFVIPPA